MTLRRRNPPTVPRLRSRKRATARPATASRKPSPPRRPPPRSRAVRRAVRHPSPPARRPPSRPRSRPAGRPGRRRRARPPPNPKPRPANVVADEPRVVKASKRPVSLRRLLVAGILVWLPIIATLWVVSFFMTLMDSTLGWLPARYQPQTLLGFHLPGLGVLFAFIVVLLTGLLVTNLI